MGPSAPEGSWSAVRAKTKIMKDVRTLPSRAIFTTVMLRWVRLIACILAVAAGAVGVGSCVLNPQPEPPSADGVSVTPPPNGGGGSAGSASTPGPAAGGSYDSQDASAARRSDGGTSRAHEAGLSEGGDADGVLEVEPDAGSASDAADAPDMKTTTGS